MNKSLSGLSQRWEITKGSTLHSQKHLSARSDTLWNNFISLSPDIGKHFHPSIDEGCRLSHICSCWPLLLWLFWSQSPDIQETLRKIGTNKSSCMSSALDHMLRLKLCVCVCVCTEDQATDPVKQWPSESEGGLAVHSAGLLFSLVLYWAMIGPNLAWSSVETSICLW